MKCNEITQKRISLFKANKRGYISLIIFTVIFIVTLFAEVIANDKPLVILHKGRIYLPITKNYTESFFGGEFEIEADFHDPYVANLINQDGFMIWPMVQYKYDTIITNLPSPAPSPPTLQNPLGTDEKGRDVLARLIYGFRISVLFGLALTFFSSIIGISVGALQGYYGGVVDLVGQRFMEIWSGMPTLFLLIILASIVEPNFWWLLGITLLFGWMSLVGVIRAEFLRGRNFEYVIAARALGMSNSRIMFKHILPNAMVATFTFLPFILGGAVTTLSSLDFLGFGLPPRYPSLGELLAQGKANLQAPWLGISAFIVLSLMLSLLVFIGEAFRDAMDPRKTLK